MDKTRRLIWLIEGYASSISNIRLREDMERNNPDAFAGSWSSSSIVLLEQEAKKVMNEIEEYLAEHFMLKPELPEPREVTNDGCM